MKLLNKLFLYNYEIQVKYNTIEWFDKHCELYIINDSIDILYFISRLYLK